MVGGGVIGGCGDAVFVAEWVFEEVFCGARVFSVLRAAVLGTPLPLCSCSVLPAAIEMRRSGASKGSTVSFLIATPENGADSIAVSYALLGPFFTVVRPIAAIVTAMVAGVMTEVIVKDDEKKGEVKEEEKVAASSCCSSDEDEGGRCCGGGDAKEGERGNLLVRIVKYAFLDLYRDLAFWMIVGLVIAAVVQAFVPAEKLTEVGSGLGAMLVMLVVGVPLYICATASTPLAAAMLLAGVSPGSALVFLLAGPATNVGSLAIIRREIGNVATGIYLVSLAVCTLGAGLLMDYVVGAMGISVLAEMGDAHSIVPVWLAMGSAIVLGIATAMIFPWKRVWGWRMKMGGGCGCGCGV